MYYGREPERPPRWWEEVWVLTRVVFGLLFWPIVALIGVVVGLLLLLSLFEESPLLALAMLIVVGVGGWFVLRWLDRRRSPTDLH